VRIRASAVQAQHGRAARRTIIQVMEPNAVGFDVTARAGGRTIGHAVMRGAASISSL